MVNGLDEGWVRVSSIKDSGLAERVAPPTKCPHNLLAPEQAKSIELLAASD